MTRFGAPEINSSDLDRLTHPEADASGLEQFWLNMGPSHPSTHGVFRMFLRMEGEQLNEIECHIGYLHRGIEKLMEGFTWAQNIALVDRLDYLAGLTNEHAYVLAVEKLAKVEVPERAEFIRVICDELMRIASHLVWLGTYGVDLGATTMVLYCFRERELIMELLEELTGQRMTFNYYRIGGVKRDLPEGWVDRCWTTLRAIEEKLPDYEKLLLKNAIFQYRTKDIGFLKREDALALGISGPNLRGSGVDWDLRRDKPYSVYDRFKFEVPIGQRGDSLDRAYVRYHEMHQAIRIIRQALQQLPEGPTMAKVPRVLKPEAGEANAHIEAPRGDLGFYLISDGGEKPYRANIKAPSFIHIMAVPYTALGLKLADLVASFGSLDVVMGEVDR